MLSVAFLGQKDEKKEGYWIEGLDDPTFFPGKAASIHANLKIDGKAQHQIIGHFGVLHPTVLKNYDLSFVVSAMEINLEAFL